METENNDILLERAAEQSTPSDPLRSAADAPKNRSAEQPAKEEGAEPEMPDPQPIENAQDPFLAAAQQSFTQLTYEMPDIPERSLAALCESEEGRSALELWANGIPLATAYKVTHLDAILLHQAAVAKQAAMNAMNGKRHLQKSDGAPGESVVVPGDVYEQYKAMLPHFSDAQIRASYAKYCNGS